MLQGLVPIRAHIAFTGHTDAERRNEGPDGLDERTPTAVNIRPTRPWRGRRARIDLGLVWGFGYMAWL